APQAHHDWRIGAERRAIDDGIVAARIPVVQAFGVVNEINNYVLTVAALIYRDGTRHRRRRASRRAINRRQGRLHHQYTYDCHRRFHLKPFMRQHGPATPLASLSFSPEWPVFIIYR